MRPWRCSATARSSNVRRSSSQRYISSRSFSVRPSGTAESPISAPSPMTRKTSFTASVGAAGSVLCRPHQPYPADLADPILGIFVGGARSGDVALARHGEDALELFVDPLDPLHRPGLVVTSQLILDVDEAPGIDHEVRCVQDAEVHELVAVLLAGQLIVGRARDDLAIQIGHRVVVDDPAQGARA